MKCVDNEALVTLYIIRGKELQSVGKLVMYFLFFFSFCDDKSMSVAGKIKGFLKINDNGFVFGFNAYFFCHTFFGIPHFVKGSFQIRYQVGFVYQGKGNEVFPCKEYFLAIFYRVGGKENNFYLRIKCADVFR